MQPHLRFARGSVAAQGPTASGRRRRAPARLGLERLSGLAATDDLHIAAYVQCVATNGIMSRPTASARTDWCAWSLESDAVGRRPAVALG